MKQDNKISLLKQQIETAEAHAQAIQVIANQKKLPQELAVGTIVNLLELKESLTSLLNLYINLESVKSGTYKRLSEDILAEPLLFNIMVDCMGSIKNTYIN